MPKLKNTDEVLIYPYGGWHYHVKGCWMARTDMECREDNYIAVLFREIKEGQIITNRGYLYQPCGCVERYEKGLPQPNRFDKEDVGGFDV